MAERLQLFVNDVSVGKEQLNCIVFSCHESRLQVQDFLEN